MEQERQGSVNTLQVRAVCKIHCNNGWMSTLEQQAKPILVPLILGQQTKLDQSEQKLLAAWIAKTAMVLEHAYAKNVSSSLMQRRHMMDAQEPPNGWNIWIGHYRGEFWKTAAVRKSAALEVTKGGLGISTTASAAHNTQSVTFGIGELVVQIMATSIPFVDFGVPSKFEPYTPQLWPIEKPFNWPTSHPLNDADVNILSNGLSRMLRGDADHFDPPP